MFFPQLDDLRSRFSIPVETVGSLDNWLFHLMPAARKAILPATFANQTGFTYDQADSLFAHMEELGFVQVRFEYHCPVCDDILFVTELDHAQEEVVCQEGHTFVPADRQDLIIVSYRFLLKDPEVPLGKKKQGMVTQQISRHGEYRKNSNGQGFNT